MDERRRSSLGKKSEGGCGGELEDFIREYSANVSLTESAAAGEIVTKMLERHPTEARMPGLIYCKNKISENPERYPTDALNFIERYMETTDGRGVEFTGAEETIEEPEGPEESTTIGRVTDEEANVGRRNQVYSPQIVQGNANAPFQPTAVISGGNPTLLTKKGANSGVPPMEKLAGQDPAHKKEENYPPKLGVSRRGEDPSKERREISSLVAVPRPTSAVVISHHPSKKGNQEDYSPANETRGDIVPPQNGTLELAKKLEGLLRGVEVYARRIENASEGVREMLEKEQARKEEDKRRGLTRIKYIALGAGLAAVYALGVAMSKYIAERGSRIEVVAAETDFAAEMKDPEVPLRPVFRYNKRSGASRYYDPRGREGGLLEIIDSDGDKNPDRVRYKEGHAVQTLRDAELKENLEVRDAAAELLKGYFDRVKIK